MFYVSSVKDNKVYVVDTSDGVEEVFELSKIESLVRSNLVIIHGVLLSDKGIKCRSIKIDQKINYLKLMSLLKAYMQSDSMRCQVELSDYLASAKVGTKIFIQYLVNSTTYDLTLVKESYDNWMCQNTYKNIIARIDMNSVMSNLHFACKQAKFSQVIVRG